MTTLNGLVAAIRGISRLSADSGFLGVKNRYVTPKRLRFDINNEKIFLEVFVPRKIFFFGTFLIFEFTGYRKYQDFLLKVAIYNLKICFIFSKVVPRNLGCKKYC